MNYTQEKFFLGIGSILSSGLSGLGAIMTDSDAVRYLYLTLSVCIITATFLALVFRKQAETMRVVIGRCGLAILGGVFGTRILMHHVDLSAANGDVIYLLGISSAVTIVCFLIGYVFLRIVEKRSSDIANSIFNKLVKPDMTDKRDE